MNKILKNYYLDNTGLTLGSLLKDYSWWDLEDHLWCWGLNSDQLGARQVPYLLSPISLTP